MDVTNLNAMIGVIVYKKPLLTEMTRQPRIYFSLVGEKGCLCFNDQNTHKRCNLLYSAEVTNWRTANTIYMNPRLGTGLQYIVHMARDSYLYKIFYDLQNNFQIFKIPILITEDKSLSLRNFVNNVNSNTLTNFTINDVSSFLYSVLSIDTVESQFIKIINLFLFLLKMMLSKGLMTVIACLYLTHVQHKNSDVFFVQCTD
ncbi:hypothetical protein AGLY_011805 [Aphis glycines]|uniref:Uncharacterized protein n=1 Tax=Aphis glycines TaxID=307491 RepID=A0A6G0TB89_APHGL|nr:hypothetical protein AGLY_011805 [Aphis glycines]